MVYFTVLKTCSSKNDHLKEQKARVIESITSNINERLSVVPEDIFIVIEEPPLENWGIAGRQMSAD